MGLIVVKENQIVRGVEMFSDIKVPFNSVMLYNVAKLKDGVSISDVEEHLGTMCNIVKNKYKGFLAGQVF